MLVTMWLNFFAWCLIVSFADVFSCAVVVDGCSDLWSVWLLMIVFVIGFDCRGSVVWKFIVGFYLGVKWAPYNAFKPYPKVV